eukprot:TRINITY_DN3649_c0_g1_i1.p1 TRINITY_DN3649_c0_g1~~TRINITY_DN3649_c0_g1_i1.p1  ORF type:complete len:306 (+),score=50.12 TRINITY_DN3649_c0_g1_i1:53-970(+)
MGALRVFPGFAYLFACFMTARPTLRRMKWENRVLLSYIVLTLFLTVFYSSYKWRVLGGSVFILIGFIAWRIYQRREYFFDQVRMWSSPHTQSKEGLNLLSLQPYSQKWAQDFAQEKARIESVLFARPSLKQLIDFTECSGIEHVGSTAIHNMLAKPLHDLVLCVTHITDELRDALTNTLGYTYCGCSPHDPTGSDKWFMNTTDFSTRGCGFDLHVQMPEAYPAHRFMKGFIEYMNEHEEERKLYAQIKLSACATAQATANSSSTTTTTTTTALTDEKSYSMNKGMKMQELNNRAMDWMYAHEKPL